MTKREELNAFIVRADEMLDSKYILANVKIVNLLKTIAASETLIAIFKSCLTDFDYTEAKTKYFVKNSLNEGKGEFVLPTSSRELLALTFSVLMDVDAGKLDLGDFISKYFYENGSLYESYTAFLKMLIKPFKATVVSLMESVIEGKIQDPVEAVLEDERRKAKAKEEALKKEQKEKELAEKSYAESVKAVKTYLTADKIKVANSSLSDEEKADATLIIDMLIGVTESGDKDAVNYAFTAYKFVCRAHKFTFKNRIKLVGEELKKIIEAQA